MELSPNTWLDYLSTIAKKINHLKGTYVEMGFGKGITSYYALYEMINNRIKKRNIWGFDSFKGLPTPSSKVIRNDFTILFGKKDEGVKEISLKRKISCVSRSSHIFRYSIHHDIPITECDNEVVAKKGHLNFPLKNALDFKTYAKEEHNINVNIVKGYFKNTIFQYEGGPIAILHLDVDLYDSYKICLENLYDLVIPGGIIMFDEYKSTSLIRWPGATKAINEFFENKNIKIRKCHITNPYKTWKYGPLNSWKDIKLPRTPINTKISGIGTTKYIPTEKYYIYKPL